jgi:hypothetical protein
VSDDPDRYLAIHLDDHLGAATAGLELAKRMRGEHVGTALGAFAERLVPEIAEDRDAIVELLGRLDAEPSRLKVAGGWAAEKLGRLKLNGKVMGQSPLSARLELEGLALAIEGKRLLWLALLETQAERFGADRLRGLVERAERQRAGVEEHRRSAALAALR